MPQGRGHEPERGSKDDLKRREYRDEKGQVHHHTRSYMEQHGDGEAKRQGAADGGGRGEARTFAERSRGGERTGGGARTTTDHDEIREWAEAHGGKPAAVARTHKGGDVGIVRIMFPDAPNSEHAALTEIGWDEFFAEFEQRKLALLYDPNSLFSKIIGRDTAEKRAHGDHDAAR
jgi:hypothetical protein